ncbi:MAG: ABC transporter permease subunit [Opitutaceae bacterium]|jgi:microcin C transport system permease protein|nr:ABC transporter permease subunit [Opitutaceae bacterium]
MRLNPLTVKKLKRFRSIKRGYCSFLLLVLLLVVSLFGELLVNSRALVVRHDGRWFFPTYGAIIPGDTFGLGYRYETGYRELRERYRASPGGKNWLLMPPLCAFNEYENTPHEGVFKPAPPSWLGGPAGHLLGTDTTGRDIFARLFYAFRIAMLFALAFVVCTYLIGVAAGCAMGYFGGGVDLLGQRLIEIWSNIPFLYTVIIIASVIPDTTGLQTRIAILLLVLVAFSWTGMTYYMRTATYKEKARDYTAAAIVLGAGTGRVIFSHILPNTISTIVTFVPFTVISAVTSITALDFLGFGFPPPTPSMGELLKQGTQTLTTAPWIVISAFSSLVIVLTLVTFIGEAVREAFDPRKFTLYK